MAPNLPYVQVVYANDIGRLNGICEACALGKSKRQQRPPHELAAARPVEILYPDVLEPMRSLSVGKGRYFVTLFDEYSGLSTV